MTDETFKVGDAIRLRRPKNGEAVIVEQILSRGKTTYYLCSWRDQSWQPIMYSHDFVEKIKP